MDRARQYYNILNASEVHRLLSKWWPIEVD